MQARRFDAVMAAFTVICVGCLAVYAYFMLTVPIAEPPEINSPWQESPDECYEGERCTGGWAVIVRHEWRTGE